MQNSSRGNTVTHALGRQTNSIHMKQASGIRQRICAFATHRITFKRDEFHIGTNGIEVNSPNVSDQQNISMKNVFTLLAELMIGFFCATFSYMLMVYLGENKSSALVYSIILGIVISTSSARTLKNKKS